MEPLPSDIPTWLPRTVLVLLWLFCNTPSFSQVLPEPLLQGASGIQAMNTRPLVALPLQETDVKIAAARWSVTEEEWRRYVELMQGEAALHYAHMEPIAILGIYAENEEDRLRYAQAWQEREKARVKKLLDFQFAARQVASGDPPIDAERLAQLLQAVEANKVASGVGKDERLALFIGIDCAECDRLVRQVLQRGRAVDIYFLDAGDDDAIQTWAADQDIPIERVSKREVTLNHDAGTLRLVSGGGVAITPALYVQRNEGWIPIRDTDL